MPVTALISGRATRLEWDFGDGPVVSDAGFLTTHVWTNPGDYTVSASVFNLDNPSGVVATASVRVVPAAPPLLYPVSTSNGALSLQFQAQPGLAYQLQSTTNLSAPVNWQPEQTFYGTGPVSTSVVPSLNDPGRFYRIQVR